MNVNSMKRYGILLIVCIICSMWINSTVTAYGQTAAAKHQSYTNRVVKKAKSRLGYPYVWGGKGDRHFDCSGFVYWIFKNSKVPLKKKVKRSSCQGLYGSLKKYKVSSNYKKAKPGDIILYKNRGRYTHTAIALGSGKMIHASSGRRKVCVAKITHCRHSSLVIIRLIK